MRKKKPENFSPVPDFPKDHKHYGKPRCQAWNPNYGRQCLGLARPNGKCRSHNGSAASGIAAPNYKHGKYVSNLPKRYLSNFRAAQDNPDYLKLQDDIHLVDARLMELTGSIDEKSSSLIFDKLSAEVSKMEMAQAAVVRSQNITDKETRERMRAKANADYIDSVSELSRLIKRGAKEWYIWHDITDLIEKRRRLVETERKLLVDMQNLIRIEDTFVRFDILMESIRRNVPDRDTRAAIQSDYNAAVGR